MKSFTWVLDRFKELPEEYSFTWMAMEYFYSERMVDFYYGHYERLFSNKI